MLKEAETEEKTPFFVTFLSLVAFRLGVACPSLATPMGCSTAVLAVLLTFIRRDHICYLPVCFRRRRAPLIFSGKMRTV